MDNYITNLVLNFFENKNEAERRFLIEYITSKAEVLLSSRLISKKDENLADFLAKCVYIRETALLAHVMDVNADIENENKN